MSIYRRRLMIANALKKSDSNINYPGLIAAWSAKGKSNDDADRAVLRDLTGNGHDLTLNNFAFSGMSGYGGYNTDFNKWSSFSNIASLLEKTKTRIKINRIYSTSAFMSTTKNENVEKYKITGLVEGQNIKFGFAETQEVIVSCESDGIYTVDWSKLQGEQRNIYSTSPGNYNLTISLVPEYPDALVFDGVDDYGYCAMVKANLFNESFTIICKREYITEPSSAHKMTTADCRAANVNAVVFILEGFYQNPYINVYNIGNHGLTYDNAPVDYSLNTVFLTPTNYNGHTFEHSGDNNYEDDSKIRIGGHFIEARYANMAFYSAYLFDRSLDEQEIKAFIRKYIDADYLLPSEQQTIE